MDLVKAGRRSPNGEADREVLLLGEEQEGEVPLGETEGEVQLGEEN